MRQVSLATWLAFCAGMAWGGGAETARPTLPNMGSGRPGIPAFSRPPALQARVTPAPARSGTPGTAPVTTRPFSTHHDSDCRPHHRHHSGLVFRSYFFSGYPAYYGNLYGYDPYAESLRAENSRLFRELQALGEQNEALRERLQRPERMRVEVPDGRRRVAAERAQQMVLSGMRLFKKGDYRRAADRFADAIKAAPDEATAHFYRGLALFALRDSAAAAQALKAGLALSPDWPLLDFDVRQLYGDADELVAQLAAVALELKANPLDRDRLFLLGFVLFVSDDPGRARPLLEQLARLEADDGYLKSLLDYYQRQDAVAEDAKSARN